MSTAVGWTGEFFEAVVGRKYTVPEDSVNYVPLRGKTGVCTDYHANAHGHSWTKIKFDDIEEAVTVRTSYLVPAEGEEQETEFVHIDKGVVNWRNAQEASMQGDNHGTAELHGV